MLLSHASTKVFARKDRSPTTANVYDPSVESDAKVSHQLTVSSPFLFRIKSTSEIIVILNEATLSFLLLAPCDSNPCSNSGQCNVVGSAYRCTCLPGYTGTVCEVNVRPGIERSILSPNLPTINVYFYFYLYGLATCSINCSPGYCFSNPGSNPPYACYCPNGTMQLKSC